VRAWEKRLVKDLLVTAIAAIYILVATSHLFYLPNLNHSGTSVYSNEHSLFNRKLGQTVGDSEKSTLVRRIDSPVFEEKKNLPKLIRPAVVLFCVLLLIPLIGNPKFKPDPFTFSRRINYQGSYLITRTFRI
jgi:hypothetical protein